ncbi:MAG: hypothetical protein GX593_01895 [Actinomycetales bacterium]|nr:hypothetical protein [Actinomycetales bacterium]
MKVLLVIAIWAAALALSVWVGAWLTGRLLARVDAADRAAKKKTADDGGKQVGVASPAAAAPAPGDGVDGARVRAVLRGGWWIGILERLAVTGCILVGFTPGIAVVVAVKGLGRFPQLRDDPAASERFVIGSLVSLLWSAAVGFAALALLGLVT